MSVKIQIIFLKILNLLGVCNSIDRRAYVRKINPLWTQIYLGLEKWSWILQDDEKLSFFKKIYLIKK